jgi:hypothetical protein
LPPKWEYVVGRINYADVKRVMNDAGSDGWEAFAVTPRDDQACLVFFKRPVQTPVSGRDIRAVHSHESIRLLIREKVASGILPAHGTARIWGGPANGETCLACNDTIANTETLIQCVGELDRALQFHVTCFFLWSAERDTPGTQPST